MWSHELGGTNALNSACGLTFWSQRCGTWDEILPPMSTTSNTDPSRALDSHGFSSDAPWRHYRAEADTMRSPSMEVEVLRRAGECAPYLSIINHSDQPVGVTARGEGWVAAGAVAGRLVVTSGQARLVREEST